MRGPNIDSDHFLVKAVIKQKLSVIYNKKLKPALKWNKINLQNPSKLKEYRSLLHNKWVNLAPKQEIDEEWEQIEIAIVDAAREVGIHTLIKENKKIKFAHKQRKSGLAI